MTNVKLFGLTVATLLACAHLSGAPRDLDAVEIFSGVGSIAAAAQSQGFAARPFDKYRVMGCTDVDGETSEDMTVKSGFMNAVELVFRLRLGGLLWLAPVCASWIGLNISRTRRSAANMYHGDTTYPKVAQGNVMATACAMLMELAHSRGVELVLENPPCSSIFNFPPIARVLQMLSPESCVTHRCAFDRGSPDGKKLWKKYKFVGSRQWIQHLARPCTCKSREGMVCGKGSSGHTFCRPTPHEAPLGAQCPESTGSGPKAPHMASAVSELQAKIQFPSLVPAKRCRRLRACACECKI